MSYIAYPFAVVSDSSGKQLIFTFALPIIPASQLQLTNPWYVNTQQLDIKIDRFNQNLVHFGDDKGVITVNYLLSSSPSPAGGLASWVNLVTGLFTPPVNNTFSANKNNVQAYPAGGAETNVVWNNTVSTSTDLSYNAITGVWTVLKTGDYAINASLTVTGAGVHSSFDLFVSGVRVQSEAFYNAADNSAKYIMFSITRSLTAGQTFSLAVSTLNAVNSIALSVYNWVTVKRIPTAL